MKRSSEPRSEQGQRVLAVLLFTFILCFMGFGNFFHKDNAEYFLPNLFLIMVNAALWTAVIATWLAEAVHLWRQARMRFRWSTCFGFACWLLLGGAYVGGGAFMAMSGWVLRLAMSDDLR